MVTAFQVGNSFHNDASDNDIKLFRLADKFCYIQHIYYSETVHY
jgi:hypothetical protein